MLRITDISLRDFRSYERLELPIEGRLTILVGPNAVGKTNIVEAVQLLTAGQSFRRARTADMLRSGAAAGRAAIRVTDGNRQLELAAALDDRTRKFTLNGKPKRVSDMRGIVPSVTFTPDDLDLVKGAPAARRGALDALGVQLNRSYQVILQDFEKVLRHKNHLLKDGCINMLDAVNDLYIRVAAQLQSYRMALFARLEPKIAAHYAQISGGEALQGVYAPSGQQPVAPPDPVSGPSTASIPAVRQDAVPDQDPPSDQFGESDTRREDVSRETSDAQQRGTRPEEERPGQIRDALHGGADGRTGSKGVDAAALRAAVEQHREEEVAARRTLVGPSHDRIAFAIGGMDAGKFASQGQQRSAVLAWKLAEADTIEEMLGTFPVLLLDDVMSELDGARRAALVDYLQRDAQALITTANLEYFDDRMLAEAQVVQLPLL